MIPGTHRVDGAAPGASWRVRGRREAADPARPATRFGDLTKRGLRAR